MIDVGQTGVIFNYTSTNTYAHNRTQGPSLITTELHPEASGTEPLQYIAALQQLLHDVSETAAPPPGYFKGCKFPNSQLDSTVKYLQAALVEVRP